MKDAIVVAKLEIEMAEKALKDAAADMLKKIQTKKSIKRRKSS